MKRKLIMFSAIVLTSIMLAGGTSAWFVSTSDASVTKPKMATVKVDVIEKSLDNIKIKNSGSSQSYIRVRLIPQWSDQSLSTSNVKIKLADNWIERDGYYYYKYPVKANRKTSTLVKDLVYTNLTPEYEGASFTLKVVAEGVQKTHQAWKDVWNINSLPF